jgi:hypothetical protein
MVVQELVAVLGTKIEKGDFADVFALLDKLSEVFSRVFDAISEGLTRAFGAVDTVANLGDEILAVSEKFGIAADALQELRFAAIASDASAEALDAGLKFLSRSAVDAAKGGKEAAAAFAGVNLKTADGQIRPVADLLTDVADQFAVLPDGAVKVEKAIQLFGKAGADLIPLLNQGSEGISSLRAEFVSLGGVLSGETLQAAGAYDDAVKRLQASQQGLLNRFASPVIPKVTALFQRLTRIFQSGGIQRAIDFLSRGFDRFLTVLDSLASALESFTASNSRVEAALFVITAALTGVTLAAVSAGGAMVLAALETIGAWLAAAAPFILIGGLIALIVDEIATFVEGGDSLLGRLIRWFDSYDPEEIAIIRLLRTAGSLIFDLTDTAKWDRFGRALYDNFVKPLVDGVKALLVVANPVSLISALRNPANLASGATDAARLGRAALSLPAGSILDGASFLPSVISPAASAAAGSVQSIVNVTVPPGSDARGIAESVRDVVRRELDQSLSEALPVVGR